jgi:hypothetical protein
MPAAPSTASEQSGARPEAAPVRWGRRAGRPLGPWQRPLSGGVGRRPARPSGLYESVIQTQWPRGFDAKRAEVESFVSVRSAMSSLPAARILVPNGRFDPLHALHFRESLPPKGQALFLVVMGSPSWLSRWHRSGHPGSTSMQRSARTKATDRSRHGLVDGERRPARGHAGKDVSRAEIR